MMSSRLHCRRAPPPMDLSAHLQGWQNVNASGISLNVSSWRRWKINSTRKSFFGKEGRTCFGLLTNFSRQRKTSKDFCKPFPPWISRPVQLITCIAVLWNCADSNWNPQPALHDDGDDDDCGGDGDSNLNLHSGHCMMEDDKATSSKAFSTGLDLFFYIFSTSL